MSLYLLDTNAVSAIIRDAAGPVGVRAGLVGETALCTSVIVAAEIRYGVVRKNAERLRRRADAVLGSLLVHPWDAPADRLYGTIRTEMEQRGDVIGQFDLLIAAHALALDCTLVTGNEGEFRRVPGLRVENWLSADGRS